MSNNAVLKPEAIQALRNLASQSDPNFVRELIEIYLADTPQQLARLEEAVARQDSAAVIRAAHTIKGSSGNFGATRFTELAMEIETQGKANNMAAVAALIGDFKGQYSLVVAALQRVAGGA